MPKICSVEGCDRPVSRRKFCSKHYSRWYRTGDPTKIIKYNHNLGFNYKGIPEHNSWQGMKQRCYYTKHAQYKDYGGRGIKVCDRWLGPYGFQHFYEDMGEKPAPKGKYSIDRIDPDGDYTPENCRWADRHIQSANRRWGKKDSKTPGVWKYNERLWCVSLTVDKKEHRRYAKTEDEAIAKRKELESIYLYQEK